MNSITSIQNAFQEVYAHKRFFLVTVLSSGILYSLNAVIRNYTLLKGQFSFSLLLALIGGIPTTFTPLSLILLVTLSLLGGIVFTFSLFILTHQTTMSASASLPGILGAVLAPACPACALGVFGTLGIGGLLTFLPWKGLEFGFLAIGLLLGSLFYLSKKISTKTCDVK